MDSCTKLSVLWLILSSLVVIWDAGFVLLRPRTLPGGDLHQFWKPCKKAELLLQVASCQLCFVVVVVVVVVVDLQTACI